MKAIELAKLHKFIEKLPDGIDTFIGEDGSRISGGQRQRIGIARALYNDPKLLILDEATSSLDLETEKEIMDEIDQLKGKKTVLIISHRQSTLSNCDQLFSVDKGKLVVFSDPKNT